MSAVIRFPVERTRPAPLDWTPMVRFADQLRAEGVAAAAARTGMTEQMVRELIDDYATPIPRRHLSVAR